MEIKMSLDRITIVGAIIKHRTALNELVDLLQDTSWNQVSDSQFDLSRYDEDGNKLENVAVLLKNKYQDSYRLDTSNHLKTDAELKAIQLVVNAMAEPHITRTDIAHK